MQAGCGAGESELQSYGIRREAIVACNRKAGRDAESDKSGPQVVVVDKPNMLCPSDQYYWVEFPLPDVFKLDVSRLHSFDDYVNTHLRKRHRRAFHVRQNE